MSGCQFCAPKACSDRGVYRTNPHLCAPQCYSLPEHGRSGPVRSPIAAIVVAPLILGSLPAFAQGSPSADQIINSLKPSGNLVTGGTRGIRLAAPTNEGGTQQPTSPAPSSAQQPRLAASKPVTAPATRTSTDGPAGNLT